MKTKKTGLVILLAIIVMSACLAPAARAAFPPCRDVTIWIVATADGVSKKLYHSVTDPVLNTTVVGSSVEVFNTIDDFRVVDGVVIGVGSYYANPGRKYVYLSVYDPVLQGWREEGVTDLGDTGSSQLYWDEHIASAGGVVAMCNTEDHFIGQTGRAWAKTYDPQRGQWQGFYAENGDDTLGWYPHCQDGIALFHFTDYIAWDRAYYSIWALYDPRDGVWHSMQANFKGNLDYTYPPTITNATVYNTEKDGTSQHYGYVSSTWQAGQVTVPVAWFQVAPTTGPPPLNVWITDMSLGGTTWTTDFGEGAGPQNFRSGLHTFGSQGPYNVIQKVSNPNFSLSNITVTQAVRVLDITAPVCSMYIEPAPWYGGAYTMVNNAMYINTTDIYVNYTVNGMDAGSTMRFYDSVKWTDWLPYNGNISVYEIDPLPAGDGLKTVVAQFKDWTGNVGEASASVYLDTTAPVDGTVAATPGPAQVTLKWGGFSDAGCGIAFYRIYCSTAGYPAVGQPGTLIKQTTSLSFVHRGLKPRTTYYYRVVAKDRLDHVSAGVTVQAVPKGVITPILRLLLP